MKSLQYVIRFVSRSRTLMIELCAERDIEEDFEDSLRDLLQDITFMMSYTSDCILREQGACLKYLPSTIPDILLVFDPKELSVILCNIIKQIPPGRLTKQKMMTINEIVHSKLFFYVECRKIMLPVFMKQVKFLFEMHEEVRTRFSCLRAFKMHKRDIRNRRHVHKYGM
jgi:dedicator of cytokinesis protein 1